MWEPILQAGGPVLKLYATCVYLLRRHLDPPESPSPLSYQHETSHPGEREPSSLSQEASPFLGLQVTRDRKNSALSHALRN